MLRWLLVWADRIGSANLSSLSSLSRTTLIGSEIGTGPSQGPMRVSLEQALEAESQLFGVLKNIYLFRGVFVCVVWFFSDSLTV